MDCGVLQPMCSLLEVKDHETVMAILEGLANILKATEDEELEEGQHHQVLWDIKKCGGLDHIESLKLHDNEKINRKASDILTQFFFPEVCFYLCSIVQIFI
jgi:Atypical Arm repeat